MDGEECPCGNRGCRELNALDQALIDFSSELRIESLEYQETTL